MMTPTLARLRQLPLLLPLATLLFLTWQAAIQPPVEAAPVSSVTAVIPVEAALFRHPDDPVFAHPPRRVVSLDPAASEILSALGAADAMVGITIQDRRLDGFAAITMVGGAGSPSLERILALEPDCVVATSRQGEAIRLLKDRNVPLVVLGGESLAEGRENIRRLGAIMGKQAEAEALLAREEAYLDLARRKAARLSMDWAVPRSANPGSSHGAAETAARPASSGTASRAPERSGETAVTAAGQGPLRVLRLLDLGDGGLRVPGDNSFHNELIRNAGGQPPSLKKYGPSVEITPEEWQAFNPEAIYLCGQDPARVRENLAVSEWGGITALDQGRILSYPCEVASRAGVHYGYFSLWLSSDLYGKEYAVPESQISGDAVTGRKPVDLPFASVREAALLETRLFDMPVKTLTVHFNKPQTVLSSLSGWAEGITAVGNHYSSPPTWTITHHLGLETTNARLLALLGLEAERSAFLFTGVDMDNYAYAEENAYGFRVGVIATAGVSGNAMRSSVDEGRYVEPGTINIIVLTNRRLPPDAMSRAVITATEGKTAALEDLDIRSSYTGVPATGTGTDNVLVVSGEGPVATPVATLTGGHAKLGELIARSAYRAVRDSVAKQNRLMAQRDIFQRLAERKLDLNALLKASPAWADNAAWNALPAALEQCLLEPRYADFLAGAFALSDNYGRGLIRDRGAFSDLCLLMASELAGKPVQELEQVFTQQRAPALNQGSIGGSAAHAEQEHVPPNRHAPGWRASGPHPGQGELLIREALNALATGLLRR